MADIGTEKTISKQAVARLIYDVLEIHDSLLFEESVEFYRNNGYAPCSECGSINSKGNRFCRDCGKETSGYDPSPKFHQDGPYCNDGHANAMKLYQKYSDFSDDSTELEDRLLRSRPYCAGCGEKIAYPE